MAFTSRRGRAATESGFARCRGDQSQEDPDAQPNLDRQHRLGTLRGIGLAAAQNNPPADQKQQPSGPPPAEASPVPAPRLPTQPPGQEADNAKPTMLQPEHSATPDKVAEPVPGATRQTVPSTISAANAAQDKLPILAMQLPLTDEQKSKISASLGKAPAAPAGAIQVTVAQSLPRPL